MSKAPYSGDLPPQGRARLTARHAEATITPPAAGTQAVTA